jgi:hypothetical protein
MKFLIISFTVILCALSFDTNAQLAIINDPDGFVNVRDGKGTNAKVVGKLYNGQIFLFDSENKKDEWIWVSFDKKNFSDFSSKTAKINFNDIENGTNSFIHRSRLLSIDDLPHLQLNQKNSLLTEMGLVIKNDTIKLSIKTKSFLIKNHKIHRTKEGCIDCTTAYVDKIDGKKPIGVDGGLPTVEISSIQLNIHNTNIDIPNDSFNDLYQPRLGSLNIYFDKKGNTYLYMPGNSDGAGAYDVVWVIKDGLLITRYFDSID